MSISALQHAVAQLSPYMTELELDVILDVVDGMATSKWDKNLSAEDSVAQIKLSIGSDRTDEIIGKWKAANPQLMKLHGTRKYKHIATNKLYDGLDAEDNPEDYVEVWV